MCLKSADWIANSVDADQTAPSVCSEMSLKIKGKYFLRSILMAKVLLMSTNTFLWRNKRYIKKLLEKKKKKSTCLELYLTLIMCWSVWLIRIITVITCFNVYFRWKHHLYRSVKALETQATLMTMKKNLLGSHQQKNVQRNLQTFKIEAVLGLFSLTYWSVYATKNTCMDVV